LHTSGSTCAGDALRFQTGLSFAVTASWTSLKFSRDGARCTVARDSVNGATVSCSTLNFASLNEADSAIEGRDGMPCMLERPDLMPFTLTMYLRKAKAASGFLLARGMANMLMWKKLARPASPFGTGAIFQLNFLVPFRE
jgi:hypothetical protein